MSAPNNKVNLTLTSDDAKLLAEVMEMLRSTHCPSIAQSMKDPTCDRALEERRWLIRWAIRSVAAAIKREGRMVCPLAVDIRSETSEERRERLGPDWDEAAWQGQGGTLPPEKDWTDEPGPKWKGWGRWKWDAGSEGSGAV